jgi:chromosome segregation ATPase
MGREVAEQATERRGRVRRFLAWLGYGPEVEPDGQPDRDGRRGRGRAEAAERRARRRAERLERRESTPVASAPAETLVPPAPNEIEQHLVEMESRARTAEQRALDAQKRIDDAEARAERERAAAEEAKNGIGAISTKLARAEAERRLHEQAARRWESRCGELRSALDVEREEKTAIVEHFDRRLAAIEETAATATKRVAAAERELIKDSSRPWLETGQGAQRSDRSRNGDPLEALESSIGPERPHADGRARGIDRPWGRPREPSTTR